MSAQGQRPGEGQPSNTGMPENSLSINHSSYPPSYYGPSQYPHQPLVPGFSGHSNDYNPYGYPVYSDHYFPPVYSFYPVQFSVQRPLAEPSRLEHLGQRDPDENLINKVAMNNETERGAQTFVFHQLKMMSKPPRLLGLVIKQLQKIKDTPEECSIEEVNDSRLPGAQQVIVILESAQRESNQRNEIIFVFATQAINEQIKCFLSTSPVNSQSNNHTQLSFSSPPLLVKQGGTPEAALTAAVRSLQFSSTSASNTPTEVDTRDSLSPQDDRQEQTVSPSHPPLAEQTQEVGLIVFSESETTQQVVSTPMTEPHLDDKELLTHVHAILLNEVPLWPLETLATLIAPRGSLAEIVEDLTLGMTNYSHCLLAILTAPVAEVQAFFIGTDVPEDTLLKKMAVAVLAAKGVSFVRNSTPLLAARGVTENQQQNYSTGTGASV